MKNKTNIYITNVIKLMVIVLLVSSCSSTKEVVVQKHVPKDVTLANSLLWKIEGNGLTDPSFLYGTIHMIDAEDYFLPNGTLSAMDGADKMVFEIDMNEMSDMGAMMGLMTKAFMKDGKSLKDLLSEEDYNLVNEHFKAMGLPLMFLERLKPAFLTVFASDVDPNGMQNGSIKSYEMEFFEMAKETGKAVAGLETIEFQMGVFDSIPYTDQAIMLVDAIKAGDSDNDEFKKMVEMYKAQNINAMVSMIEDDDMMGEGNEDILLTGRNKNWIPVMDSLMRKEKIFFAVGAGHLAGNNGVINLLRRRGFNVTAASNN